MIYSTQAKYDLFDLEIQHKENEIMFFAQSKIYDLINKQVSTFHHFWNCYKSFLVLKASLVFIFGLNLKTRTLLRPRPKLNNIQLPVACKNAWKHLSFVLKAKLNKKSSEVQFHSVRQWKHSTPLQSIVARKYLATTTLCPPQWGTLWGGALNAED